MTKVTHHDATYIENSYNSDGTLAWTSDEFRHTTTYTYDDYKRVTSVKNPLNQTTSYNYAQDWVNPYLHTTSSVKGAVSPSDKAVHFGYDENWRGAILRQAPGTADDAWTFYGYDAAGNLTSLQDPRGKSTSFGYDERNRRTSVTDPAPFNNQVSRFEYDGAGNLTKEIRPDNSFLRSVYDAMNRVTETFGYANERTATRRDLSGNVDQITDAKSAIYDFGYDYLNRKISAGYPLDSSGQNRTETWGYDAAGNMDLYKNPAGQYKHVVLDSRNRPERGYWNNSAASTAPDWTLAPETISTFDAANRLTELKTKTSATVTETTVAFGYDDANRQIWEDQTFNGVTRRVTTERNADGFRKNLLVPAINWVNVHYTYNNRGQLERINEAGEAQWFKYNYDLNGNMTKRQNVWAAMNNATNVEYDELNRPTIWENTGTADTAFARSRQQYDSLSRLTATWRDEQASKGERFGYDSTGQLTSALYNAEQVWTGNPLNPTRTVGYNVSDFLNRTGSNGVTVNESGTQTQTAYTPNSMNQYSSVGGQNLSYDGKFNLTKSSGWKYSYNAENRLTAVSGSGAQFVYDGLGRCVKRTVTGVSTFFLYDGWKPVMEYDAAGNNIAWNVYGPGADEILYRWSTAAGEAYYHTDRMGNVMFLLDGAGAGIERYTYDAFGSPTVTNWDGSGTRNYSNYGNRFMFTGREWLSSLGIYDYRNRFYDPVSGRFLQADPLGFSAGDANLFRYCAGDPVNRSDPMGLTVLVSTKAMGPGGHTWITLIPNNPAAFSNNPAFSNGTVTVSGQPSGNWRTDWGTLTSTTNTDLKSTPITSIAISPPSGQTDTDFISSILAAVAAFSNNTYPYALVPALNPGTYNSNSYIAWILNQVGYNGPGALGDIWGWLPGSNIVPPLGTLGNPPSFDQGVRAFGGGGGGGGENGISHDNGSFSSFTNNSGYGFTTSEGNSAFGFSVDLSQAGQNAYLANPTGNPAGGGPLKKF